MSTRTIIEINHDFLNLRTAAQLIQLAADLGHTSLQELHRTHQYDQGIRILGQRHHSDPEWEQRKP